MRHDAVLDFDGIKEKSPFSSMPPEQSPSQDTSLGLSHYGSHLMGFPRHLHKCDENYITNYRWYVVNSICGSWKNYLKLWCNFHYKENVHPNNISQPAFPMQQMATAASYSAHLRLLFASTPTMHAALEVQGCLYWNNSFCSALGGYFQLLS